MIKHTHDGVVLGAGGKLPALVPLEGGTDSQLSTPAAIMLNGTAARILFGDPALVVCDGFLRAPFSIKTTVDGSNLRVTATLANPDLKSTFTDTYHNDLNPKAPFNDRALLIVELPGAWNSVSGVEVGGVISRGKGISNRLVGFALERDGDRRRLHIQIDIAAQGFQQSPLRIVGAKVEFVVTRNQE